MVVTRWNYRCKRCRDDCCNQLCLCSCSRDVCSNCCTVYLW